MHTLLSRARRRWRRRAVPFTALLLATTTALAQTPATAGSGRVIALETSAGPIHIRLFHDAAPDAVDALLRLADDGHFDGLAIDYTRPHVELRTAEPARRVDLDVRIDARRLGLDERVVDSAADAMNVVQGELIPAYRRSISGSEMTRQLEAWLAEWFDDYDPAFLVGTTHQAVNEALGYVYTDGIASRPVTKGTVALMPRSPTVASTRLSIALADMPRRTGKWMVVGEVTSGLALADRISTAPLVTPRHTKPLGHRPAKPVIINSARCECAAGEATLVAHHGEKP